MENAIDEPQDPDSSLPIVRAAVPDAERRFASVRSADLDGKYESFRDLIGRMMANVEASIPRLIVSFAAVCMYHNSSTIPRPSKRPHSLNGTRMNGRRPWKKNWRIR